MINSMLAQVHDLPHLLRTVFDTCVHRVESLDTGLCRSVERLYVTGCGDSHHAALSTELAFESLAGVPTEPMTAMQLGRYAASCLPELGRASSLAIGISVSGSVARTAEALGAMRAAGVPTLALTGHPENRLAKAAGRTLLVDLPAFPDDSPNGTPGVRSYACNQLALLLLAVRLGEARGRLTRSEAQGLRRELRGLSEAAASTIEATDAATRELATRWGERADAVFLGAGPHYGTALFSAAKLLEACGDSAVGQDTEEWAHLQYYTRAASPTFVISAGGNDRSRALEVCAAARAIGRQVVAVMPRTVAPAVDCVLALPEGLREAFSPVVAAIPAEQLAAHRAELLGETFFRTGRGLEISRIRTSETLTS
jgi:glucosamine--fructose-6-phosphate aminotransferase (isomerizing)